MNLVFDDDRGYEAFQFLWIALTKTDLELTDIAQLMTLHSLNKKLAAVSKPTPEGGRVLARECEIELTTDEQVLALSAFANTNWKFEVYRNVRRACAFLGAEFEEQTHGSRDPSLH
jgi:hypothetical protein